MPRDLSYVRERMDSLHDVDTKIVSFLQNLSDAVGDLQLAKAVNSKESLAKFKQSVAKCYDDLSDTAIHLRREVRYLDDRISGQSQGDFIMLPVEINKKATWVNEDKIRSEASNLPQVELPLATPTVKEESTEFSLKGESTEESTVEPTVESTAEPTAEPTVEPTIKKEVADEPMDDA